MISFIAEFETDDGLIAHQGEIDVEPHTRRAEGRVVSAGVAPPFKVLAGSFAE